MAVDLVNYQFLIRRQEIQRPPLPVVRGETDVFGENFPLPHGVKAIVLTYLADRNVADGCDGGTQGHFYSMIYQVFRNNQWVCLFKWPSEIPEQGISEIQKNPSLRRIREDSGNDPFRRKVLDLAKRLEENAQKLDIPKQVFDGLPSLDLAARAEEIARAFVQKEAQVIAADHEVRNIRKGILEIRLDFAQWGSRLEEVLQKVNKRKPDVEAIFAANTTSRIMELVEEPVQAAPAPAAAAVPQNQPSQIIRIAQAVFSFLLNYVAPLAVFSYSSYHFALSFGVLSGGAFGIAMAAAFVAAKTLLRNYLRGGAL